MSARFGASGLFLRWLFALALVLVTLNPTGYSFVHWVAEVFPRITPLQAVAALSLLILWIFLLRSTLAAIGALGVLLLLALGGSLVWLLVSWGWLSLANRGAMQWAGLTLLSAILGVGMSWAHLRRRLTGQSTVDDIDDQP